MTSRTRSRTWARTALVLAILGQSTSIFAQTWCGKNYLEGQAVIPPGGKFPDYQQEGPGTPVLTFRCRPAIKPYLASDASSTPGPALLVSSEVSNTVRYPDSQPYNPPVGWPGPVDPSALHNLTVTVTANGTVVATTVIPAIPTPPPNSIKFAQWLHSIPLDLSKLRPRREHYDLECSARTDDGQTFRTTERLSYLPDPRQGSVTKMDLTSGGILAKEPDGTGEFRPIIPMGFYTQLDDYLDSPSAELTLSGLKEQGFNVIHPIPPFRNLELLDRVLDAIEGHGFYLMYDMRHTYQNASQVREEVNRIKNRKNLLLWYTADEPDGTSDPLDATLKAYNLIHSLDGGDSSGGSGYHPVSLVLNCQDYEFTSYASGADIILQDVYTIGNDPKFSSEYNTECTPDFGVCGCDNCAGSFSDISDRLSEYRGRLKAMNREGKALWSVPQAFGESQFWKRNPTGREFIVQSALSLIHGSTGLIPWMDPTTNEIKAAASNFSRNMVFLSHYVLAPDPFSVTYRDNGIELRVWSRDEGNHTLILATSTRPESIIVDLGAVGVGSAMGRREGFISYRWMEGANYTLREREKGGPFGMHDVITTFEGHGTLLLIHDSDLTGAVGNGTSSLVNGQGRIALITAVCLVFLTALWAGH